MSEATLHLLCGKIAAGKSTLAAELGRRPHTLVIREDEWLARLYADEIVTFADYVRCSKRLRAAMEPHLVALLRSGLSVVLDFHANTLASRAWMRALFEEAGTAHALHYLDVPDEVCRRRLHARNARGDHEFSATDDQFDQVTAYFIAPGPDEGFNLILHRP